MIPDDLKYTENHEWVAVEGKTARMGITDHAQEELGDIVFVELPAQGRTVEQGEEIAFVESVKAVSEISTPIGGVITAVNERLEEEPELMNAEPYGDGYLCEIRIADSPMPADLMSGGTYREFLEEGN